MLTTVEGVYENGRVRLLEPVPGIARARVVVTILPDAPIPPADPLDLPLTADDRAVWDELPRFRAEHPLRLASMADTTAAGVQGFSLGWTGPRLKPWTPEEGRGSER